MAPEDSTPAPKSPEVSQTAASEAVLNEDRALAFLKERDLLPELIERLSKNSVVMKSRKVKRAVVAHPRAPHHVAVSIIRQLFTFDLMQIALLPGLAGDLKVAAEEALIKRLESVSSGEKISLARRASGRVAGMLLLDPDPRIIRAALENPRMTEVLIVRAVARTGVSSALVLAVCNHPKWSLRRDIRIALLRNEKTPMGFALEFAHTFPAAVLKEVLENSRLPRNAKNCLLKGS
ncbi:MAG: hypothetical protein WB952_13875 [Terriglobales bacterium]